MELTLEQIKDFAIDEQIYQEALLLYNDNKVVSLEVDPYFDEDTILVHATIKDTNSYSEVNLTIDKDDNNVKVFNCSSCYNEKHNLICPHVIAVLIKLFYQQVTKKPVEEEVIAIDPALENLIKRYEETIVYSTLAQNYNQGVNLEPILTLKMGCYLALSFKIGNEKTYKIKDIKNFIYDMEHHNSKDYGIHLNFFHSVNSFNEESKPVLEFLTQHYSDNTYYSNQPMTIEANTIVLMKESLDSFFELYKDKELDYLYEEKKTKNLKFIDSNPDFTLFINRIDDNNYELSLNHKEYSLLKGSKHIYIIIDHKLYRCDEDYSNATSELLMLFTQSLHSKIIHKNYMRQLYASVLNCIAPYMPIEGDSLKEFSPLPLNAKLYLDMPKINTIACKLIFAYGSDEYNAFLPTNKSASRTYTQELSTSLLLQNFTTRIDYEEGIAYIENSQDAIYEFLNKGFNELNKCCYIYATDAIKAMEIKDSGAISLGVRIENDLLQIDFTTSQFPIDELSEVLKAYRSKRKYYRMKNGSFVNIEDSSLFELSSVLDTLHLSDKQLAKGKIKLPTYHALSLDNSLKNTQSLKVDRDHNFKAIIRDIKNIQDSDYEVPASMKPILRNYQKSGYRWLKTMAAYGFGAILADDMGIGKTIQVITLLEDEKIHNPKSTSIVVCPTSLILNWESEIHKFSKILNPLVINGNANQRKQQLKKSMDYDIVITSYDYLKRDYEELEDFTFNYAILDEAQYIKNHTTKNAESVKEINSLHKFALTGTPIENSLAELWSIFDFLMPGYLYTYSAFKKNYEIAIVKDSDQDALNELKKLVEPFILRRIKKDVLQELPEKVENTLHVDLDEEAQKLYSANLLSMKDELQESISKDGEKHGKIMVLSMLTKLRQICCDPHLVYDDFAGESAKLLACMELIENAAASKKKVLIFSQFTSLLSIIENKLVENEISYYLLKGSTPKTLRQQMVSSFNNDDTQVFLISLKAGGTGLNLTSAEVVIHFDPWWNVSAQNQATDRAYRMGQHNNVQVYKLIAKNTIEEKIQELQDLKKDLSDSIINENNGLIHDMSTEELIGLLN